MSPNLFTFLVKRIAIYFGVSLSSTRVFFKSNILAFLWLLSGSLFIPSFHTYAATKTWTGTSGAWTTGSKWSGGVAPVAGDDVIFNTNVSITNVPNITLNSLTVSGAATVTLAPTGSTKTITLSNSGAANDFDVQANCILNLNAVSITMSNGSKASIASGATLSLNTTTVFTLSANSTADLAGDLYNSNTTNNTSLNIASGSVMTVSGKFHNLTSAASSAIISPLTNSLVFIAGSRYDHARNGGEIPGDGGGTPKATWDPGSTCEISGCTNSSPTNFSGTFGNVIWSSPGTGTLTGPITIKGNIDISSGTFSTNNSAVTVNGNWVNSATFTSGSSGDVNFNSTSAQTISGNLSGTSAFQNIIFSGTGAKTFSPANGNADVNGTFNLVSGSGTVNAPSGLLKVKGNWINDGGLTTFNPNNGTVSFVSASGGQNISGNFVTTFNTVSFSGSGAKTFTLDANVDGDFNLVSGGAVTGPPGTLKIKGNWSNTGAGYLPNNGTVEFTGSLTPHQLNNATSHFFNLVHNDAVNIVLQNSPLLIDGDLTNSSGTIDASPPFNNSITVAGSFINAGTVEAPQNNLFVGGTWQNDGVFNPNNGTVRFNGNTLQSIISSVPDTFDHVVIDNLQHITLTGLDVTINSSLDFISGKLITQANSAILSATALVTGANATSYIDGNEIILADAGVLNYKFEVGRGTSPNGYGPVEISFATGFTCASGIKAFADTINPLPNENNPISNSSGIDQSKKVNRFWSISTVCAAPNYNATFYFNAGEISAGANTSNFVVRKFNSTSVPKWSATNNPVRTGTSTQCTSSNGKFGEFEIGEKNEILVASNPVDAIVCEGDTASFIAFATASSKPTAGIKWERKKPLSATYDSIFAALDAPDATYSGFTNTETLAIINPTKLLDGYLYRAVFTNINGTVTTTPALLTINDPLKIATDLTGGTVNACVGDFVYFQITATGPGVSYQWYKNSSPIPLATNPGFVFLNATSAEAGNYYCIVSGDCPDKQSKTNTLVVHNNPPAPLISETQFAALSPLCSGSAKISVNLDLPPGITAVNWSSAGTPQLIIEDTLANAIITAPNTGNSYQGNLHIEYIDTYSCKSDSDFTIQVNSTVAPDTAVIVLKKPGPLLFYLDNSPKSYQWGYDRASDRKSFEITGQVFQVFVPDAQFKVNTDSLNETDYYYWILVSNDSCKTKVYHNGPYAPKKQLIIPQEVPDEIVAVISPNPNNGKFTLTVSGNIYQTISLKIVNTLGETVIQKNIEKSEDLQSYSLDVSQLTSGLYSIEIMGKHSNGVVKRLLIN